MIACSTKRLPQVAPEFAHIKRYWDAIDECVVARVQPGEYYLTTEEELISTVLGSCVSACVRDPIAGVGGLNHFMLPAGEGEGAWSTTTAAGANRYGNYAMEHLINDILNAGGMRKHLEFKVFGGGRMIQGMADVGKRNVSFIRKYLATEGFNILAEDLGSVFSRKVLFSPLSGRVRVKKFRALHSKTVAQRDTEYEHTLTNKPISGDVELF